MSLISNGDAPRPPPRRRMDVLRCLKCPNASTTNPSGTLCSALENDNQRKKFKTYLKQNPDLKQKLKDLELWELSFRIACCLSNRPGIYKEYKGDVESFRNGLSQSSLPGREIRELRARINSDDRPNPSTFESAKGRFQESLSKPYAIYIQTEPELF